MAKKLIKKKSTNKVSVSKSKTKRNGILIFEGKTTIAKKRIESLVSCGIENILFFIKDNKLIIDASDSGETIVTITYEKGNKDGVEFDNRDIIVFVEPDKLMSKIKSLTGDKTYISVVDNTIIVEDNDGSSNKFPQNKPEDQELQENLINTLELLEGFEDAEDYKDVVIYPSNINKLSTFVKSLNFSDEILFESNDKNSMIITIKSSSGGDEISGKNMIIETDDETHSRYMMHSAKFKSLSIFEEKFTMRLGTDMNEDQALFAHGETESYKIKMLVSAKYIETKDPIVIEDNVMLQDKELYSQAIEENFDENDFIEDDTNE